MAGQVAKLDFINNKLGAGNANTQQTTRVVYDTFTTTAVGEQIMPFFKNFAGKSIPAFSNLTTNKLDSSESMVVKWISLEFLQSTYTGSDRPVLRLGIYTVTIKIGNDIKLKDFPLWLCVNVATGPFGGRLQTDASNAGNNQVYQATTYLTTNLVIPPQVNFEVEVKLANNAAAGEIVAGDRFAFHLGGYGQIFSAGNSF